ncbi:MAG TPA: HD domain-containing phosphohydrolase [Longimicrobiales bacterium]
MTESMEFAAQRSDGSMIREDALKRAKILIVDDDRAVVTLLERMLSKAGYGHVTSTTDPREVPRLHAELQPDLFLLDLHMPGLDGFQVLEQLEPHSSRGTFLPILVLTGDMSLETRRRALASGAKDFLTKPVDRLELMLRICNLLETRFLYLQARQQNESLEEEVRLRTRELEDAGYEILERLAKTAEYRDDNTRRHTERVGIRSALLARALGLSEHEVHLIRQAAPLHDVGKIGVPDYILLKPGGLTPEEVEIMKTHTLIGAQILSGSRFPILNLAAEVALSHHERWDGTGYPRGLAGEEIPLSARIVAVADFFDALAHDRPYRKAWPVGEVLAELRHQRGRQFDARVVDAFLELFTAKGAMAL